MGFRVGRFVEGLGLGGATMLAPTYVSENSPRAIRGLLIGFYQLFETMGAMVAFFIDYGSLLHIKVDQYLQLARANIRNLLTLGIGARILHGSAGYAVPPAVAHLLQHAVLSRVAQMAG
jgi:MFS family permease